MKANELRIGNKLQKDNGKIFTVLRLDNTNDVLVEEQRGLLTLGYNLFGIPLTEEWLVKLGVLCPFMLDSEKSFVTNLVAKYNEFDDNWNYVVDSCQHATSGGIMYITVPVIYVHQLQNLYFALTGEELTIQ